MRNSISRDRSHAKVRTHSKLFEFNPFISFIKYSTKQIGNNIYAHSGIKNIFHFPVINGIPPMPFQSKYLARVEQSKSQNQPQINANI